MVTSRKIKVPIYEFTIYVNIFDKWEEVKKYHKSDPENEREGFLLLHDTDLTKLKLFVNVECPSCIVHEIVHIKNIIFDVIHHPTNINCDEPEAYLTQYLYKKIVDVYYKHKDNAKK